MKSDPNTKHLFEAHDIIARIDALEAQAQIKEPLFVATANQHGQIVVPIRVRDKLGLTTDSKVAVYQIEKVDE